MTQTGAEYDHNAGITALLHRYNPVLLAESLETADRLHLHSRRLRERLRVLVQAVTQRVNQLGVIEEPNLPFQELGLHGINMAAVRQASGDDNAIETSKHSNDPVLVSFRQKGVAHAA
jgi:hypothetical protein